MDRNQYLLLSLFLLAGSMFLCGHLIARRLRGLSPTGVIDTLLMKHPLRASAIMGLVMSLMVTIGFFPGPNLISWTSGLYFTGSFLLDTGGFYFGLTRSSRYPAD